MAHQIASKEKKNYTWSMSHANPSLKNDSDHHAHYQKNINFFFSFIFCLLGLHLWHMEVPRLGVELELQPLA